MITSDTIGKIVPALLKAQKAIKHATRSATGQAGGRTFQYANMTDVIDAVKPALNENGIALIQAPCQSPEGQPGALVVTKLIHESGEWIGVETWIPAATNTAQAIGSAITYAKRYALQSLTGLPGEDDDGDEASGGRNKPKPNTAKQVATDAFDALDEDTKFRAREFAVEIIDRYQKGDDMVEWFESQPVDTEFRLAVWSQLDSKVRTAYKKQQDQARKEQQ